MNVIVLGGGRVGSVITSDTKTAKKRLKEYYNYDWWFCHKKQ